MRFGTEDSIVKNSWGSYQTILRKNYEGEPTVKDAAKRRGGGAKNPILGSTCRSCDPRWVCVKTRKSNPLTGRNCHKCEV